MPDVAEQEGSGELPTSTDTVETITEEVANRPTDPIMGRFVELYPPGSGNWVVRMGGKPNSDWTGLESSKYTSTTPFHFRKSEITSDMKGFNVRSAGLTEKFTKVSDLLQFQGRVWKHF